jgi:SAM-dependent methyltransferase
MSCSAMEHDAYFWKTAAEIRRVLKKGGLFIVGVPIYDIDLCKARPVVQRGFLSFQRTGSPRSVL